MLGRTILFNREKGARTDGLSEALRLSGSKLVTATSEDQLLEFVGEFCPDCVVLLDVPEVDAETIQLAGGVRRVDHGCPIVILASCISISVEAAIRAMRAGASDLVASTAPVGDLVATLESVFERCREFRMESSEGNDLLGTEEMVGCSAAMVSVRKQIAKVALTDANVLITGESGTGKELAAELIHRNSRRSKHQFVAVNCAAVPDTLLESELFGHERGAFTGAGTARDGKLQYAAGGTLFLDEIGDMSLVAQAKILRAIESRVIQRLGSNVDTPIKVRLVAATNQDLETLTKEKKFRQDLYFRLNVVRLTMPPLRDRPDDIPELADHIVRDLKQRQQTTASHIETEVIRRLQSYHWPGNVRELRNVIESMLVFSSSRSIGLAEVPAEIRRTLKSSAPPYNERSKVLSALTSANWNRNRAAEILSCSRMTLYRKMVKYAIPTDQQE